ncbi:MAG: Stp1/IreP family PP2C-type Ser/Thr phosphatase [Phycisphaerae bacterium]|nr:Stp1/IreP family PP2C-type Ser/Thr phosphatase [Phycisphaerae bacterium]NIP51863.1 Stp1/IreP family PP2C-type Ser/Thr phosphatase [Phycisphaerae bacterium]NIS54229.1 Stp1/IreP family PP2C-type Ser/Thr phosphatase [Phycisphaerae bacterium]NIU11854.1 Stp1/IreP family PP2C-type Ser/Thr phosphatase [Phycisphaerae bacterium]NIU59697.1 Stp1/IreP family PP2C-type Ser/Thr phosphatase [Phycisphaerae bacterium]
MEKEPIDTLSTSLPFRYAGLSHIGKVRRENEDTFLMDPELGLFLVSDGMGGHRGGELASKIVTEDLPVTIEVRLDKLKVGSPATIRSLFKKAIIEQSRQLHLEGTSETGYKDMGATLVAALLRNNRAYIANLGDSRIYRFRNRRLLQLTKDHSVISELLDKGKIKPEEAENHEAQGEITHYIGMEDKAGPHIRSFQLKKDDRLLLCTDGLTDEIDDKAIAAILAGEQDCAQACQALVDAANTAGGQDNITVVIVDWRSNS